MLVLFCRPSGHAWLRLSREVGTSPTTSQDGTDSTVLYAKRPAWRRWGRKSSRVRPVFPALHQPSAYRVFPHILPFSLGGLFRTQQAIKAAGLPLPSGTQFHSNLPLERGAEFPDRLLTLHRSDKNMQVVRHQNGGDYVPPLNGPDGGLEGVKRLVIGENSLAPLNAQRQKTDHLLVGLEPNGNSRRMSYRHLQGKRLACRRFQRIVVGQAPRLPWTLPGLEFFPALH